MTDQAELTNVLMLARRQQHILTAAGAKKYGEPVGALITLDPKLTKVLTKAAQALANRPGVTSGGGVAGHKSVAQSRSGKVGKALSKAVAPLKPVEQGPPHLIGPTLPHTASDGTVYHIPEGSKVYTSSDSKVAAPWLLAKHPDGSWHSYSSTTPAGSSLNQGEFDAFSVKALGQGMLTEVKNNPVKKVATPAGVKKVAADPGTKITAKPEVKVTAKTPTGKLVHALSQVAAKVDPKPSETVKVSPKSAAVPAPKVPANPPVSTHPLTKGGRNGMGDLPLDQEALDDLKSRSHDGAPSSASRFLVTDPATGVTTFTPERQALHDAIIKKWLANDAKGKKPVSRTAVRNPTFSVLGGGPAAGKSVMVDGGAVDDDPANPAVLVNADEMKGELPEYLDAVEKRDRMAGALVHEESGYLARRLQAAAQELKYHVTLDGTGDSSVRKMTEKIADARALGYGVNGYYATVPTETAVMRAAVRGEKTGRFVPEEVIRVTHAGVSKVLPGIIHLFDKVTLFDTSSAEEEAELKVHPDIEHWLAKPKPVHSDTAPPRTMVKIASAIKGKPLDIHDRAAWQTFLDKEKERT